MEEHTEPYGILKDGTILTEEAAGELVASAFAELEAGQGKLLKSPRKPIRIKTSVRQLPDELQEAALYK
jgi:hypothetical protein